jgi:hypothetical protein
VGDVGLDISEAVSCDRRPATGVDARSGFEAIMRTLRTWMVSDDTGSKKAY